MDTKEAVVAISDPGEVDKDQHNQGDRLSIGISNLFAWIFPILMVAICSQVVLRTLGRAEIGPGNQAWLDDFQWWLYGAAVLVGIGYAITTNSHVRVDIFYDNFSKNKQHRIDIIALTWFFLPFVILCWDVTLTYAISSIVADEGSDSPNGLHNLWILKIFMNLSFVLMGFAAWAVYIRRLSELTYPNLWKQLLVAFPSTMFAINLCTYYAIWWIVYLTSPEGTTSREVGRHSMFDKFEFLFWEIKYTIPISLVATIVVIGLTRLLDRGRDADIIR